MLYDYKKHYYLEHKEFEINEKETKHKIKPGT